MGAVVNGGTTWAPPPVKVAPVPVADADLISAVEAIFTERRVGVRFDGGFKTYVYSAPSSVHVNSLVLVPGSSFKPEPHIATVVTLNPPKYRGPVKAVLEVLS